MVNEKTLQKEQEQLMQLMDKHAKQVKLDQWLAVYNLKSNGRSLTDISFILYIERVLEDLRDLDLTQEQLLKVREIIFKEKPITSQRVSKIWHSVKDMSVEDFEKIRDIQKNDVKD